MGTTATTLTSSRQSLAGYEDLILQNAENVKNKSIADDRDKINKSCNEVHMLHQKMCKHGVEVKSMDNELENKEQELTLWEKAKPYLYKFNQIDEKDYQKMRLNKLSYYMLPIADGICASLAMYKILCNTVSSIGGASPLILGCIICIPFACLLSVLGRVAKASMSEGSLKKLCLSLCVLILPSIYILGEVCFSGGETWPYTLTFAAISMLIQICILSAYDRHIEALDYFRNIEKNNQVKQQMDMDKAAINSEINSLKNRIEQEKESFRNTFNDYGYNVRELASQIQDFEKSHGEQPKILLTTVEIFVANALVFSREVIPFHRDSNGDFSKIITFEDLAGSKEMVNSQEILAINYALNKTRNILSLDVAEKYMMSKKISNNINIEDAQEVVEEPNNGDDSGVQW